MDRVLRLFLWVLAALLTAALTHFSAILILPSVATRDAYHRLAAVYHQPGMILLPPAKPGDDLIPFRDPAAVQGLCFFDLTTAPLKITAPVAEGQPFTLAFRTSEGKIFYSMTDRGALDGKIDIRLVSPAQREALEAADDDTRAPGPELRLEAPAVKGMIVATALMVRPWEREDAEARIKAVSCQPES